MKEGCGKGRQQHATVYDIPISLILDRKLRSLLARQEMDSNPGGRTVSAAEAGTNGLLSEYVTPGPVKASGDVLRTNMNGALARRSPLMGFDRFRLRSHKRAYIGEIVMGPLSDGGGASSPQVPCQIISIYWDDDHESIRIGVQKFRTVEEVKSSLTDCNRAGLKRLWEKLGSGGEVDVNPGALLRFSRHYKCGEVYTKDFCRQRLCAEGRRESPLLRETVGREMELDRNVRGQLRGHAEARNARQHQPTAVRPDSFLLLHRRIPCV